MLLDVCIENLLIFSSYIKYINILCCIIIFLCIVFCVCFLTLNHKIQLKNSLCMKITVVCMFFTFLFLIIFSFLIVATNRNFEGCYCNVTEHLELPSNTFNLTAINDITNNKVVIVGDSRMEYIRVERNRIKIPINYSFVAKSGSTIEWFEKTGLPELREVLNNANKNYSYHVVINMGVNDLNDNISIKNRVTDYFEHYKQLSIDYPNVKFYLLTVNPIITNKIKNYFPTNGRTNEKIIYFNYLMNDFVQNSNLSNLKSCDTFNNIKFASPDGLHYDYKTDEKILDYISNKCIEYN